MSCGFCSLSIPLNDWNPESKFHWKILESSTWNPKSTAWNPGSKAVCPVYTITMNLLDIPIPFIQISTSTEWQFNVYEFLERWIHALIAELSDRFCRFPVVMFVLIWRGWTTLTWRLHTNFHKFGCIVSPNVSRMKNCAGLNLSLDIYTFTFFHIHDSGLYLMNGFNF